MADMVDGEKYSFPECGGTSVGAVLMSEDLRHAFSVYCTDADEDSNDRLPLLLDKILHCSYDDVVQYISSQLSILTDSCTTAATAAVGDDVPTQHKISMPSQINTTSNTSFSLQSGISYHAHVRRDTNLMLCDVKRHSESVICASAPPVKLRRTTELAGVDLASTAPVIICHNSDGNSISVNANDDDGLGDDDEAKCKQADVACGCEALLSSSIGQSSCRVFCKDCYQRMPAPVSDCSMLPSTVLTAISFFFIL